MTKARPIRLVALMMAVLLLAGCASGGNTNVIIVQETMPPAAQADYTSIEGYYAPESPQQYDGEIYQAPPDLGQPIESAESAETRQGTNEASMTDADFRYGVVVGSDAAINPFHCRYRDLYAVNDLVFEGLVEFDESMKPSPMLADEWTVAGDVWEFKLRSGVSFHNGQMLTAYDVVASYEEIKRNPSTVWYELVQSIEGMQVVDDLTLRVKSAGPGQMMLYAMTFPVAQAGTVSSERPMGTGPYWYIRYDTGISLRLESNPGWWRRPSGVIQSVVVLCYKSVRSALVGLEMNEVDALATDYPSASLSRNLTDRLTRDYTTQTYECIVPNLRHEILSDISVRQALMYAIDRATLGNTIYAGMVQESEVPVIPGSWLYNPQATRFNYSPERALQLLYDAGWSDPDQDGVLQKQIGGRTVPLSLTLISYDRGTTVTRSEAVEEIARQLRIVGFDVKTQIGTQTKVFDSLNNGNFELALVGYELNQMPNLAFLLAGTARNSSNFSRYSSSVMDGFLKDAYDATSEANLVAAMADVQMQVVEDLPILGLFFRAGTLISRASVGGLSGNHQYNVLRGLATVTPTK